MKALLLGLALVSSVASAAPESAFPRVSNFGTYIQVTVTNWENRLIMCSGSVTMNLENGQTESELVGLSVFNMGSATRQVYPRTSGQKIKSFRHSIWCN